MNKFKEKRGVYFFVLLMMLLLTTIFLNSFYWPYEEISKRKILVGMIAFSGVVILPILSVKINVFYIFVVKIIEHVEITIEKIKHNQKRIFVLLGLGVIVIGISGLATYFVCALLLQTTFSVRMFYLIMSIIAVILVIIYAWKTASKKPEKIFLCVAIIMGIFCIGVTPGKVGISWDDQIHYENTLKISNFLNGIMYSADEKNINVYVYQHTGYDRETELQYIEDMQRSYGAKECCIYGAFFHEDTLREIYRVAYIPAAIGIVLARGLGLSYIDVFNMGRLFNLLTYIMLVYLAIKRIKHGKILIATIGLLPPIIFMASCYSYDPWVIGFTILGFAYFFAELQEDTPLQNKNIAIMVGALVLGCLPKAIYFAMLFPLLFMPKKKFQSSKQRTYYYLAIILGGLILVASFLLPMFVKGPGIGDVRGGVDVNATEQIKFILNNPLAYAKTLLKFCLGYISMNSSGPMLQFFAYVGQGQFWGVVAITLVVIAFLDRESKKDNHTGIKFSALIGCVATLVLSATALYISFTAVGSDTVAGMSGRYLIPIIYPALYSLGIEGTTHKINKNALTCVPMIIMAVTFIYNISNFCVIGY